MNRSCFTLKTVWAKHCQLNANTINNCLYCRQMPAATSKVELKKRKIRRFHFQQTHLREERLDCCIPDTPKPGESKGAVFFLLCGADELDRSVEVNFAFPLPFCSVQSCVFCQYVSVSAGGALFSVSQQWSPSLMMLNAFNLASQSRPSCRGFFCQSLLTS